MVARWLPTAPGTAFFLLYVQTKRQVDCLSPNQTKVLDFTLIGLVYVCDGNGFKLSSNSVLTSGIGGKGSMTLKLQNNGGGEKSDVARQFTMCAMNQACQFCMGPEKGDIPSNKCFPCFFNRVILEAFTVFLKVCFTDQIIRVA